jgi:hypothetical protein
MDQRLQRFLRLFSVHEAAMALYKLPHRIRMALLDCVSRTLQAEAM